MALQGALAETPRQLEATPLTWNERRKVVSRSSYIEKVTARFRRNTTTDAKVPENQLGEVGLNLLHDPPEPLLDFIFVHGLGGGSRKTWSFHPEDPSLFWPKEWLPAETGFESVRIHSYGYDSNWARSGRIERTIQDFAEDLLRDIYASADLHKNGKLPIVFVAHSMGGLVVKKAYLLSRTNPMYKDICSRTHTMVFLATPHRGSDSAGLLTNVLSVIGPKSFVNELDCGSDTLFAINDEFRNSYDKLELWSFYEEEKTGLAFGGLISTMVVKMDSGMMLLPRETIQGIPADHRRICKFEFKSDANYRTLVTAFNEIIARIQLQASTSHSEKRSSQMRTFFYSLEDATRPESDFYTALDKVHHGSCLWLTDSPIFRQWSDESSLLRAGEVGSSQSTPRFFLLHGAPGSGKTVATASVISYLQSRNLECSYFFFNDKTAARPTVSQLLQSLAFQMTEFNPEMRKALAETLRETSSGFPSSDHKLLWSKLYLNCLLKSKFRPQFWVFDALDECPSEDIGVLIRILASIHPSLPLRIFISSRPSDRMDRLLTKEKIEKLDMRAGEDDSKRDIESFVRWRIACEFEDADDPELGDTVVASILSKANGNFLWTSLVVQELEEAQAVEEVQEILDGVPTGMTGLYHRILGKIKSLPSADIGQCALKWVLCSPRRLSMPELREAVRLDIGRTMLASQRVGQICGNFVTLDSESRVQLMHQTAKEFLIGDDSDVYIDVAQAHRCIASLCLDCLVGPTFAPPDPQEVDTLVTPDGIAVFDRYACESFSYHLVDCDITPEGDELLQKLDIFASSNILTWMERSASSGRLAPITRAVEDLKTYLTRAPQSMTLSDPTHHNVSNMVTDVERIIINLGPCLTDVPAAIHFILAPLCPTSTALFKAHGNKTRALLSHPFNNGWDEQIACLTDQSANPVALACNDEYLAMSLSDGSVKLHSATSFEEVHTIRERGSVIGLGTNSNVVACCSPTEVSLLGASDGTQRWSASLDAGQARERPLSVAFSRGDDKLYIAMESNRIMVFHVKDGSFLGVLSTWGGADLKAKSCQSLRMSPHHGLVAFTDGESHLHLFKLDTVVNSVAKIGLYEQPSGYDADFEGSVDSHGEMDSLDQHEPREQTESYRVKDYYREPNPFKQPNYYQPSSHHQRSASYMIPSSYKRYPVVLSNHSGRSVQTPKSTLNNRQASPGPGHAKIVDFAVNETGSRCVVAVQFSGDSLATMDPFTLKTLHHRRQQGRHLAISSQGTILATMHLSSRKITLFNLETLMPLCQIPSPAGSITVTLMFSSTGRRLFDMGDRECNVWEPAVLTREAVPDGDARLAQMLNSWQPRKKDDAVVSMAEAEGSRHVFCGRRDGCITLHDVASGTNVRRLHVHRHAVKHLGWSSRCGVLISIDDNLCCVVTRFSLPLGGSYEVLGTPLSRELGERDPHNDQRGREERSSESVQLLMRTDGSTCLVSVGKLIELWDCAEFPVHDFRDSYYRHFGASDREKYILCKTVISWPMGPRKPRWIPHPLDDDRFFLIDDWRVHRFRWYSPSEPGQVRTIHSLTEETCSEGLLVPGLPERLEPDNWVYHRGTDMMAYMHMRTTPSGPGDRPLTQALAVIKLTPSELTAYNNAQLRARMVQAQWMTNSLLDDVRAVIGLRGSSLFFLSRRGWVCSIDVESIATATSYTAHFFIPPPWLSMSDGITIKMVSETSVAMTDRHNRLIVFHGFLEFKHRAPFRRPTAGRMEDSMSAG